MLRTMTCSLLLLGLALFRPAAAVHDSGSAYEIVGFTADAGVLVRQVSVQEGVVAFRFLAIADGSDRMVRQVGVDEDPVKVETRLGDELDVYSRGYPGSTAPDRGAAVLVYPGPVTSSGDFDYNVQATDGDGSSVVALVPAPATCTSSSPGRRATLRTRWAPDGSAAVLAGSVVTEQPCGWPVRTPVLVLVTRHGSTSPRALVAAGEAHEDSVQWLARERPHEALELTAQLLAVAPRSVGLISTLARLRASTGDSRGALCALWALYRLKGSGGPDAARVALRSEWARPLRRRAAGLALEWTLAASEPSPRPRDGEDRKPGAAWYGREDGAIRSGGVEPSGE